jgi:hypothetical protein
VGGVIYSRSDMGLLEIDVPDGEAEMWIKEGGQKIQITDLKTGKQAAQIALKAGKQAVKLDRGEYELAMGANLTPDKNPIAIKRGRTEVVNVRLVTGAVKEQAKPAEPVGGSLVPRDEAFERWLEGTKKLPAQKRVEAVKATLKERNPGFDGQVKATIKGGEVTELNFNTDQVVDVSPLRAFPRLSVLRCTGHWPRKGKLVDLTPLQGLPLRYLDCRESRVSDLNPLRHLPLTTLLVGGTYVKDLAPLHGLRLRRFECYYSAVKDLTPLAGMPLVHLEIGGCPVRDLSPVRGMPLERLGIKQTLVKDLTPLEGSPLQWLDCTLMTTPNLTPLRKTRVRELVCDHPERQIAILSHLWTLAKINGKPALETFQRYNPLHATFVQWIADTRKLSAEPQLAAVKAKLSERNPGLDLGHVEAQIMGGKVVALSMPAEVTDLAPVRALSDLRMLRCSGAPDRRGKLSDLSPLVGLSRLDKLYVSHTAVADLAPLRGLGLTFLHCQGTGVQDLAPVEGMPLQELGCDLELAHNHRDTLRAIKTLQIINSKPVAEFWQDVDVKKP